MTAVLAGCGDLGIRTGLRLATAGYRVLGLRRTPERLPDPLLGQAVDLHHQTPRLPADTAIVIVALTADAHTVASYRATYVTGLAHLLDAVDRVPGAPRLLLVSSTAVHGVTDGSWIDEHSPPVPATATGEVLRDAEELLHARRPDAAVLRLSGLYGPGRGTLLSTVADGTATIPPEPVYTNRIHRDDAAAAIVHLTTRVAAPEPVYLGSDHEPAERGEVLRFLADQLGVAHPPVTDRPSARGRGKRCRNDRLRSSGFTFAFPTYREGYRAVLDSGSHTR